MSSTDSLSTHVRHFCVSFGDARPCSFKKARSFLSNELQRL